MDAAGPSSHPDALVIVFEQHVGGVSAVHLGILDYLAAVWIVAKQSVGPGAQPDVPSVVLHHALAVSDRFTSIIEDANGMRHVVVGQIIEEPVI